VWPVVRRDKKPGNWSEEGKRCLKRKDGRHLLYI
jgi:hypothetical protein